MAAQVASCSNKSKALPREVVLSIQRILEIKETDPLDALSDFNPVEILNQLFPDGERKLLFLHPNALMLNEFCRGISFSINECARKVSSE
jgi:hypothetical protein